MRIALLLLTGLMPPPAAEAQLVIEKQRIETQVDLATTRARILSTVWIKNNASAAVDTTVTQRLVHGEIALPVRASLPLRIEAGASRSVVIETQLERGQVTLWSPSQPVLYRSRIEAGGAIHVAAFGVRRIEAEGAALLWNGTAVRLAGAEAASDFDLAKFKERGLQVARVPCGAPDAAFDWADHHGFLIVLASGECRERHANRPSILDVALERGNGCTPRRADRPVMVEGCDANPAWLAAMRERPWIAIALVRGSVGTALAAELSPVELKSLEKSAAAVLVRLAARTVFPLYPPGEYQLRLSYLDERNRVVKRDTQTLTFSAPGSDTTLALPLRTPVVRIRGDIFQHGVHLGEF